MQSSNSGTQCYLSSFFFFQVCLSVFIPIELILSGVVIAAVASRPFALKTSLTECEMLFRFIFTMRIYFSYKFYGPHTHKITFSPLAFSSKTLQFLQNFFCGYEMKKIRPKVATYRYDYIFSLVRIDCQVVTSF